MAVMNSKQPMAAAAGPAPAAAAAGAAGAATANSEWQVGGRWARTWARANEVKQAGQRERQDWCE